MRLPAGTTIVMRYSYDNSADNLANQNQPPRRVVAGNRASDEMAHLWVQALPRNSTGSPSDASSDPREPLQEAMARHKVEKKPADFEAQYNLAARLQARGQLAEAKRHYQLALRIHPEDATVNNALGGVLLASGQSGEAIPYFIAALRAQPDNFDAHYNSGIALATESRFGEAIEHFRAAARLRPEDANAEANLGAALAQVGNLTEAKSHLEVALRIDPTLALARENLEIVNRSLAERPK